VSSSALLGSLQESGVHVLRHVPSLAPEALTVLRVFAPAQPVARIAFGKIAWIWPFVRVVDRKHIASGIDTLANEGSMRVSCSALLTRNQSSRTSPPTSTSARRAIRVNDLSFDGRTALVTGATSGIGRTTVCKFVAAGCRVAAVGRDTAALASLADELDADLCITLVADLSQPDEVISTVREAIRRLGLIDIAINDAGIGFRGDVVASTLDEWDLTFAVNVRAPFLVRAGGLPGCSSAARRHRQWLRSA
jgi:hypothetical protein